MANLLEKRVNLKMPIQPEFELNTQYYLEYYDSSSQLLFYEFKTQPGTENVMKAVPDGCIDILFCCHPKMYHATIYGSVLQSSSIDMLADTVYFGLRFLPKQNIQQINYAIKEFVGNQILLTDAVSTDRSSIDTIIFEGDFHTKIHHFKRLFYPKIFSIETKSATIAYLLDKIYLSRGNINMKELATDIGFSTRYLRKQFEEHVGIPPKLLCRITRFQFSLYMLQHKGMFNIQDIILENGFYDQAHFIKEFKSFGFISPHEYQEKQLVK